MRPPLVTLGVVPAELTGTVGLTATPRASPTECAPSYVRSAHVGSCASCSPAVQIPGNLNAELRTQPEAAAPVRRHWRTHNIPLPLNVPSRRRTVKSLEGRVPRTRCSSRTAAAAAAVALSPCCATRPPSSSGWRSARLKRVLLVSGRIQAVASVAGRRGRRQRNAGRPDIHPAETQGRRPPAPRGT
jgi:hypothetical protein